MIEWIKIAIDFVLHIDQHLVQIMAEYQIWTFFILFLIVFCETGLVIAPFLPGDSLLFASGAIVAMSPFPIWLLIAVLWSAGFIGDNVNYWVGRYLGQKVYDKNYRFIRREYLERTHRFYEEHGGKTVIIARFMPIIRTFAPFVAGVGSMSYPRFMGFSLVGNGIWVNSFCLAGYFFGNIPFVKANFTYVVFVIIFISLLPPVITVWRERQKSQKAV